MNSDQTILPYFCGSEAERIACNWAREHIADRSFDEHWLLDVVVWPILADEIRRKLRRERECSGEST
jgi:hypothetical protein